MRKRFLALLTACLLLGGCAAPQPDQGVVPAAPDRSAAVPGYTAPIGDAGLSYTAMATLYLPSADGQELLAVYGELDFTYSLHPAETILRALLAHPGNSVVSPVAEVQVLPAGSDPVEVSGGIATVNLSAAALTLAPDKLYTLCRAITATLCELPDVTYVNVLVAGKAVAMDDAGYLPLGYLTAQPGQDLPILWEMHLARRVPDGTLPTAVPLTTTAALYFPLQDGSGVVPEARRITFAGQHPQQLVLGLIEALSAGPESLEGASELPDLTLLMAAAPEMSTLPDGTLRVTLRFSGDLYSWLTSSGADPACTFAALVYTLTTFVPGLTEVCILTGERAVTSVVCQLHGSRLFPGGVHTRSDYTGYLMAQTTVSRPEGSALTAVTTALPYRSIHSPRALLMALASAEGQVLSAAVTDADLLGFSVSGDTLLINLSARARDVLADHPEDQRLIAYAIVNTMCSGLNVRRVRFYFDSTVVEELDGDLIWSGEFLMNPGLNR